VDFIGLHSKIGLRRYATSRKVPGSNPDEVDFFFNLPNPSSRTMAPGSTQPLTEMSTRNIPGGKGRPSLKADNLTAIWEPIVLKMWEPPRPVTEIPLPLPYIVKFLISNFSFLLF
jgi:hypothetical protein